MDQDDAEKRWGADLEHEPAEAVEQPRRERPPRRGEVMAEWAQQNKLLAVLLCILVLGAIVGIPLFQGAYGVYAYHVGTPTTATDIHCVNYTRGGPSCTGMWSVGGESNTGTIEGASHGDGSPLNVHVHDGTAYTAGAGRRPFRVVAIMVGCYIAIFGFAIGWAIVSGRRDARSGPMSSPSQPD
jgi:hypothetical protein